MKKIYNKLVRDKIPEIIRNDNKICKIKMLNEQDYILELKQKLCEEAKEVLNANTVNFSLFCCFRLLSKL